MLIFDVWLLGKLIECRWVIFVILVGVVVMNSWVCFDFKMFIVFYFLDRVWLLGEKKIGLCWWWG